MPRFSRKLRIAEDLAESISNPTESFLRCLKGRLYVGKAFTSLLLLRHLNPKLRMNFDAMMTVSGIELEGSWKRVRVGGHEIKRRDASKPDPDRWKRRKLRKLQQSLQVNNLIQCNTPRFLELDSPVADIVLRDALAKGLICYTDQYSYVERAPRGKVGHVYGLAIPRLTPSQRGVLQEILACHVNYRVTDLCTNEIAHVKAALIERLEDCKLDKANLNFTTFNEIDHDPKLSFVCSIFASCSQSRGIAMKLKAILPVLNDATDK